MSSKTNDVPEYTEALASIIGTLVAFESLLFAKLIFHRKYKVISNHSEDLEHVDKSKFFIDFVNKSRISTSIRFLGVFLNRSQFGHNLHGGVYTLSPYPSFSSNKDSCSKYMDILNNVSAYNAISFKIPLKNLIKFVLNNKTWIKYTNRLFKNRKPINFIFAFCDYNYVLKYILWN